MCACPQIMWAKYYELRCIFFKKPNLVKVCAFAWCSVKIHVFSASSLKEEKLIRKQTYMKTETGKLYSRVFWTFLPNDIKIDPHNFELYRFTVKTFFWDTVYILYSPVLSSFLSSFSPESYRVWKQRWWTSNVSWEQQMSNLWCCECLITVMSCP